MKTAYTTETGFKNLHPRGVTIAATGPVTTQQFATWITWATDEVNAYCKRTSNFAVGTRAHQVASNAVDVLLVKKWVFEENLDRFDPETMAGITHPNMMDPDMDSLRKQLDRIMTGEQPDDEVSWTHQMNAGYGAFQ